MTTAREENARTLAAALGLNVENAAALLDVTALLTAPPDSTLARRVRRVLERTLAKVVEVPIGSTPAVEIVVGGRPARSLAPVVSVGVDGYRLHVRDGVDGTMGEKSHPIIEELAACYAAGVAIRRAVPGEFPIPLRLPLDVDLEAMLGQDIQSLIEPIELGRTYMAGAGAIGNGVLLGLAALDVRGELHVCDPDHVSDGNLNRTIWFNAADCGKNKAEQLVRAAQSSIPRLRLIPHPRVLREMPEARVGGAWLERLIVAVDSRRARRSLQNELPRGVFDASTTGITEVVLHFNTQPSDMACLSCIYFEAPDETAHERHVADLLGVSVDDVRSNFVGGEAALVIGRKYGCDPQSLVGVAYDSLFKAMCGTGQLRSSDSEVRVLAPFAFVSVLAGLWLVIELARRMHNGRVAEPFNYWRVSPWAAPIIRLRELRPKRDGCEFCSDRILQEVSRKLWG